MQFAACTDLYKVYENPLLDRLEKVDHGANIGEIGMEVVLPQGKNLDTLEKFYKKYMKLLLSIPVSTADPAVYVLTGAVSIEAQLYTRDPLRRLVACDDYRQRLLKSRLHIDS